MAPHEPRADALGDPVSADPRPDAHRARASSRPSPAAPATLPNAPAPGTLLPRPASVTIALAALYLGALASVAIGVLVLLSRYRVEPAEVVPVSLLGAAIALVGLLALAVTGAVGRGDRRARLAVTVGLALLAALAVIAIVASDEADAGSVGAIVLYAVVVVALWLPVSTRWFRAEPSTP